MRTTINLLAAAVFALASTTATAQEKLRIGTASLGGAYYPMGQALSSMVNKHADGFEMVPIVTGGGAENPRLVDSGEVDLGIAPASLSFAWETKSRTSENPRACDAFARTEGGNHSRISPKQVAEGECSSYTSHARAFISKAARPPPHGIPIAPSNERQATSAHPKLEKQVHACKQDRGAPMM